jgi:hypothetical protein
VDIEQARDSSLMIASTVDDGRRRYGTLRPDRHRRGLWRLLEQAIAKEDAEAEKRDPELGRDNAARRRASRGALPAHLPRIEVTLAPEDTACATVGLSQQPLWGVLPKLRADRREGGVRP